MGQKTPQSFKLKRIRDSTWLIIVFKGEKRILKTGEKQYFRGKWLYDRRWTKKVPV